MRYRLRALLIVLAALGGCARDAVGPPAAPVAASGLATTQAQKPIVSLEWTDLAFDVGDRAAFDVSVLPQHIRRLDGKRVRVRGFFHLGTGSLELAEFLLLGEINSPPTVTKPGTPPDEWPIHQLAAVQMEAGKRARFTMEPVTVTGRLSFDLVQWQDRAFLIFRIVADKVEVVSKRPGYGPAVGSGC
jgi:hypothetical protein